MDTSAKIYTGSEYDLDFTNLFDFTQDFRESIRHSMDIETAARLAGCETLAEVYEYENGYDTSRKAY